MTKKADYSKMTDGEFRTILEEIVRNEGADILDIGDVYSELSEHYNNAVLAEWARLNPEKVFGDDYTEEDVEEECDPY